MYKKIIACILSITCLIGSLGLELSFASEPECIHGAKNVIYIIGEGMGENLIQYTQWKYMSAYEELNMQKMGVTGLVSTYSADNGTSDDASAGTQLATGSGTDNGVLGLGAELDGYRGYETLTEAAARSGKRTGIISDAEISETVASAFVAHSADAGDIKSIKNQVDGAELDVKISSSSSLADDTNYALSRLSDSGDGFVLVIDSAKIEDYAEKNDSLKAMEAVKALDDAIGAALDFAARDGETLVIVTAEHETGSVVETGLSSRSSGSDSIEWLGAGPSNTNVMLFAEGRGAEHFNGYYHSTEICRKIAHITGITGWDFYDVKTIFEEPEEDTSESEETVILYYDFEEKLSGGVKDTVGNNDGLFRGSASIVFDEELGSNVLRLDNTSGNGSYLKLPNGVCDDMLYLTIEMDIKSSQTYSSNSSTFQIADKNEPTKYFYFKYEPKGQGLRYSLNPGSEWKSSGTKAMSNIGGDEWVKLKYVIEPTKHTVYINGEEFLTYETKGSLPMLGSGLNTYIGHSMFSIDKDYTGSIDNVKISGIKQEGADEDENRVKKDVSVTPAEPITDENDLPESPESDSAKNVILLIGDGTGQNIMQLSQWHYNGADKPYSVQTMPYIGLSKTYSRSDGVTDSAAGGTALATGLKTINYYVGLGGAGARFKNLMEYARENGMATGVLTTTDITDATPAAFSAHAMDRIYHDEIASQQAVSGTDILMGGGGEYFTDLLSGMKSDGYKHVTTADQMNALAGGDKVIGLFGESGDLDQPLDGDTTEPLLDEMVKKSIGMLDGRSENGFVLMAEGALIDHYAHSNDALGAIEQAKIFDNAIAEALDFAKKDKNTLVIVTADHETGGIGLLGSSNTGAGASIYGKYKWTTGNHTSAYVPIYAYGPGAERLTGVHENTEVFDVMMSVLGIEKDEPPARDRDDSLILELSFDNSDLSTDYGMAAENGSLSYERGYKGKAVRFSGSADNYIELFGDNGQSLLAGEDSFTVTYWSKTDSASNVNWMFYAAPGSEPQKYGSELYIGILDEGKSMKAERYNYGRSAYPEATFAGDEWKHVAVTVDKDKTSLYINGELVSAADSSAAVVDILGSDPAAYIGRANWGSGEGARGLVDEYKIYNYALGEEDIKELYNSSITIPADALSALYLGGEVSYRLNIQEPGGEDVYVALYDDSGMMMSVRKHTAEAEIKGAFSDLDGEGVEIAVYAWKAGTMIPVWSIKQEVLDFSNVTLTSSQQNAAAFTALPEKQGKVVYSFDLIDNGSNDSGILLGNSAALNTSSGNYFAAGSIVILFSGGTLYTRDASSKTRAANYTVGEKVSVRIEADIDAKLYSLYVDGALAAENVGFRTSANSLNTLALVENGGGKMFNVTNLSISQM